MYDLNRMFQWEYYNYIRHALCSWVSNIADLHPPGATGRGAETLRECGAPTWRAVVCRVQTRPQLAEENRWNLSWGSQKDQECILKTAELWTENTWRTVAVKQETAMDMLIYCSLQDLVFCSRILHIHKSPPYFHNVSLFYETELQFVLVNRKVWFNGEGGRNCLFRQGNFVPSSLADFVFQCSPSSLLQENIWTFALIFTLWFVSTAICCLLLQMP